jgi:tetratricopeptide (TPR) repeat protein
MLAGFLAIGGLAGGVLLANHEREIAQSRFHQVRQLSREFLELEAQIRDLPGSTKARNHIVSSSLSYLERLGAETRHSRWLSIGRTPSQQDLELSLEIAQAYSHVAGIQGVQGANSLGQFEQAKASLANAEVFAETVLQAPKFARRAEALLASAIIAHQNMILADSENRPEDNLAYAGRAAMRLNEALALKAGALPPDTTKRAAGIFVNLTLTYQKRHRLDDASLNARRAVELARRVTPADPRLLSKSLSVLANTARFTGHFEEAQQAIEEARRMAESSMTDSPNVDQTLTLVAALWREAMILGEHDSINMGREKEAATLLRRAFQQSDALAARDSNDYTSRSYVSMAGRELGDLLRDTNPTEAISVYQRTFDRLEEVRHNRKARYDQVSVLAGMSYALRRAGRSAEASIRIETAMQILRELREPVTEARSAASEEAEAVWRALADHLAAIGHADQAITIYEDLLAKPFRPDQTGFNDLRRANRLSGLFRDLSAIYKTRGPAGTSRAHALDSKRRELWQQWDRKLPGNSFVRRQMMQAAS